MSPRSMRGRSGERRTLALRLCFVASMFAAAGVFGGLAYRITKGAEENTAIQTYESIAASALEEAQAITKRKQQGAESLAAAWSFAYPRAEQWPFVWMPGYTELANKIALLSSSAGHGFMTIVQPDQVPTFEAHAAQKYQEFNYPEPAGKSAFGFGIWGLNKTYSKYSDKRFHDISGDTTWGSKYNYLAPFLQHMNAFREPKLLLRNLHQFELRGRLMDSIVDCGKAADPNTTVSPNCGAVTNFTEIFVRPGPSAVFFNPVFPAEDPTVVVGFIGTSINWAETLTNVVPDFVDGLYCVISNSFETYTYVIQGGVPELLGKGDQHERRFDEYGRTASLDKLETGTRESASYTLTLYPSEAMYDEFRTKVPIYAGIGFTAVIGVCTCLFFVYDYFMKYESFQQKRILEVKRRFVRFISHEIRTPLNVVCLGLDLLQDELNDKLEKLKRTKRNKEQSELYMQKDSDSTTASTISESNRTVPEELAPQEGRSNRGARSAQVVERDEVADTDYWLGLTSEILENSQNAVSVLNDLLNYDKVESGSFTLDVSKVDIWESVGKTVKEFAIQARNRRIDLRLVTKQGLDETYHTLRDDASDVSGLEEGRDLMSESQEGTYVLGDPQRLSQVLRNLISNALKFTAEDHRVTVSISHVRNGLPDAECFPWHDEEVPNKSERMVLDETDLEEQEEDLTRLLAGSVRAGAALITIQDEGVGLTEEQLGMLFQEFVQFDAGKLQHGGGSGLGLTISKELIEMHAGTIVAHSDGAGKGTSFRIELPLFRSSAPRAQPAPATREDPEDPHGDDHHVVLVVDDVRTNTKMLVRALERMGHECVVAENGQEAIDAWCANAETASRPIDTILMDFEMPILNGPDATTELRAMGCSACIFGLTGNVLAEDVATFKAAGADAVLHKPIHLPAIEAAWAKHADGRIHSC